MSKATDKKLHKLFSGQKIALLGFGLENASLLALLKKKKIAAEITICDRRDRGALPPLKTTKMLSIDWQTGPGYNRDLERFAWLFRSPGWPVNESALARARAAGSRSTSPLNLFLSLAPTKKIVGVTGTKGKGTTATLIHRILKKSGRKAWLAGNIGIAPLDYLDRILPQDYVVLELSSFQLEDLEQSPEIGVITNLYPEHLAPADPYNPNFHPSLKAYWQAKLNVATQPGNRYLVANARLAKLLENRKIKSQIIRFTTSNLDSHLAGDYNKENVAAALAVAKLLRLPEKKCVAAVASFKNLEHRLEKVAVVNKVSYFDNSFATTPESSALDLDSFTEPIILIAGGADKGANFLPFAEKIKARTKSLILLPGAGTDRLKKELRRTKYPSNRLTVAKSMKEAVLSAKQAAEPGDVVLLSTGCASFGLFRNYKERGDLFKKYVRHQG